MMETKPQTEQVQSKGKVMTIKIRWIAVLSLLTLWVAPAWAGDRDYRFYPQADVYYDSGRTGYYYKKDGQWTFGAVLPDRLKVKLGDFEIVLGDDQPYRRHEEHVRQYEQRKKGGPPPWAPAHGQRRKMHYYPDQRVYYYPDKGTYWYLKAGEWRFGLSLPSGIKLGSPVEVTAPENKPYVDNYDHAKKYPPGQWKKKSTRNKKAAKKGKKGGQGQGKGRGKGKNK